MITYLNKHATTCLSADTLCQVCEYLKEAGYDVFAFSEFLKAKTGVGLPTNLPVVAQDSLQWINDKTGGYINPVNASIGIAAISSVVGMYSTYKLAQAIFRDCPTDVYNAIKDNKDHMEFYQKLSTQTVAALSQMDTAAAMEFFDGTKKLIESRGRTAGELFLESDKEKQVYIIKAVMNKGPKKFDDKLHAKREKAFEASSALEKAKSVTLPGTQQDTSDAVGNAPAVQSTFFDKVYNVLSIPIANVTYAYENYCPAFSAYVPAFLSRKPAANTTAPVPDVVEITPTPVDSNQNAPTVK